MSTKQRQVSRLAKLIDKRMQELSLTQQEVATLVGFNNRNMLTIIKNGDGKLALERVPAMAKALKVEPRYLFRLALEQTYSDQVVKDMIQMLEPQYSENERRMLDHIKNVAGGVLPEWTDKVAGKITEVFSKN